MNEKMFVWTDHLFNYYLSLWLAINADSIFVVFFFFCVHSISTKKLIHVPLNFIFFFISLATKFHGLCTNKVKFKEIIVFWFSSLVFLCFIFFYYLCLWMTYKQYCFMKFQTILHNLGQEHLKLLRNKIKIMPQ